MTALTVITSLLILFGATLMFASILLGKKTGGFVPPEFRRRWRTLITFMFFFMAGYFFFIFVFVKRLVFPIELITGLLFIGGAFFVFIVINLSRDTIVKIQSTAGELEKAENALRENERFLRTVINTEPECVKLVARDGSLIEMNPAGLAMLEADSLDIIKGKIIYQSIVPEHRDAFRKLTEDVFSGKSGNLEFMVTGLKGRKLWLETHAVPLRNDRGEIIALLGITRDVTRRKLAEDALRESEHSYRTLAANLPGIVYRVLLREGGRMVFFNDMITQLTGYKPEELTSGKVCSLDQLIIEGDRKRVTAGIEEAISQNRSFQVEYMLRHKDGNIRNFIERGRPVRGKDGNPVYIDGVTLDITELKRTEEQLRKSTIELERSNRELEHFAYMASHDLRSPIIALSADLKMFEKHNRRKIDPESLKLIDGALSSAFRMQSLITDLLTYARLGAAAPEKAIGTINLADILNVVLDSIKMDCERARCTIIREELPRVQADPTQMIQLFQNLLSNSIKFKGKELPRIEIRAERKETEWLFSIKDNGIGIPSEQSERIFELFQRASRGAEYEGTGIGLAICKRIVERLGGRIWVESELGKGSKFYFTIPFSTPGLIATSPVPH